MNRIVPKRCEAWPVHGPLPAQGLSGESWVYELEDVRATGNASQRPANWSDFGANSARAFPAFERVAEEFRQGCRDGAQLWRHTVGVGHGQGHRGRLAGLALAFECTGEASGVGFGGREEFLQRCKASEDRGGRDRAAGAGRAGKSVSVHVRTQEAG